MTSEENKKPPKSMPVYLCPYCGDVIRGNGFTRHEAACKRKSELGDDIKTLYPIPLKSALYEAFAQWCSGREMTLAEGVDALITEKVG